MAGKGVGEDGGPKRAYEKALAAAGTLAKNDMDLKKVEKHLATYCRAWPVLEQVSSWRWRLDGSRAVLDFYMV
jgi:hypothetical protein